MGIEQWPLLQNRQGDDNRNNRSQAAVCGRVRLDHCFLIEMNLGRTFSKQLFGWAVFTAQYEQIVQSIRFRFGNACRRLHKLAHSG
jgi:hypothetical protein